MIRKAYLPAKRRLITLNDKVASLPTSRNSFFDFYFMKSPCWISGRRLFPPLADLSSKAPFVHTDCPPARDTNVFDHPFLTR